MSEGPVHKACDQCNFRKVKCNGLKPCVRCMSADITCTYNKPSKRKGPAGRRIEKLKREQMFQAMVQQQYHPPPTTLGQSLTNVSAVSAVSAISTPVTLEYCSPTPFGTPPPPSMYPPILPPQMTNPRSERDFPTSIDDHSLFPFLDTFFDRLHAVLPVLSRTTILNRMMNNEHRTNPQFGAMILAICSFSLTQPVQNEERNSLQDRMTQAKVLMQEAVRMRSSYDFGERPTLDATLASFFLFATLFGHQQHNAAWFRIQEAVTLGEMLGLHIPSTYEKLPPGECEMYLRTYWILSVTERAYALQRKHPIGFRGRPGNTMRQMRAIVSSTITYPKQEIIADIDGIGGLQCLVHLFDHIDENFVDCWNERCENSDKGHCKTLTREKVLLTHEALGNIDKHGLTENLSEVQKADIYLTQQWLKNRVWQLCLSHGLLTQDDDIKEMRIDYAVLIAQDTLAICRGISVKSLEVHGIGLVEKLYDIASTVLNLLSCFPWIESAPTTEELASPQFTSKNLPVRETLNGFLAVFAVFRGGQHPYLLPLMREMSTV